MDLKDAVAAGLVDESYATKSNYCAYKFCKRAAENATKKCGAGSANTQAPRAKATGYCTHPDCMRCFHPTCHSIMHRLLDPHWTTCFRSGA